MTTYARIESGRVVEIILAFVTTEDMRPPAPAPLAENANESERAAFEQAQAAHEAFFVGEVPIEERFHPEFVATLVPIPEDLNVSVGDTFDGQAFGPAPAPSVPIPTAMDVLAERSRRLDYATQQIHPLQDLVDLGEATEEDEAKLLLWKQYRAAVGKVQTQPGYPTNVVWPVQPEI